MSKCLGLIRYEPFCGAANQSRQTRNHLQAKHTTGQLCPTFFVWQFMLLVHVLCLLSVPARPIRTYQARTDISLLTVTGKAEPRRSNLSVSHN